MENNVGTGNTVQMVNCAGTASNTKMANHAAMMTTPGRIEIREEEMPSPKAGEVLLEIAYVGICGSDAHFFESGKRKGEFFELPFILGHEASGTVIAQGEGVSDLQIGDCVTVEPQITCGHCEWCRCGNYNMCPEVVFPSVPPYHGMLRKYFCFPANLCHKLPANVSLLDGCLTEPFAVGIYAAASGEVHIGQTVAILGMGAIGLMALQACKAGGASRIIAVDLFDNRLAYAKKFGADLTVNARSRDIEEAINEYTDGRGADVVMETAGSAKAAQLTGKLVKRCGVIVMVGNINEPVSLNMMELMYREAEIRTIYRYRNNFRDALAVISSGKADMHSMITQVFPFAQTQAAFERAISDKQNSVKIVIDVRA